MLAIALYHEYDEPGLFRKSSREMAEMFLNKITEETNGRVVFPQRPDELRRSAGEILDYQRSRYIIGYDSSNPDAKSKIGVKVVEMPGRGKYAVTVWFRSN